MPSRREQILARVEAVLTAAAIGSSVTRSRERPITREESPVTTVMAGGNELKELAGQLDVNRFEFVLEHFVRGDPWDQLADPIDVAAHAALNADAQLAGMVANLRRVSEDFEAQDADGTAGTLTVRYRCTFTTHAFALDREA